MLLETIALLTVGTADLDRGTIKPEIRDYIFEEHFNDTKEKVNWGSYGKLYDIARSSMEIHAESKGDFSQVYNGLNNIKKVNFDSLQFSEFVNLDGGKPKSSLYIHPLEEIVNSGKGNTLDRALLVAAAAECQGLDYKFVLMADPLPEFYLLIEAGIALGYDIPTINMDGKDYVMLDTNLPSFNEALKSGKERLTPKAFYSMTNDAQGNIQFVETGKSIPGLVVDKNSKIRYITGESGNYRIK